MKEGVGNVVAQGFLKAQGICFDLKYGVRTGGNIALDKLKIEAESRSSGVHYQPVYIAQMRTILKKLRPSEGDVLVDYGCGKGRVLLVSSLFPFKHVVGVDFSEELCKIAADNASIFSARCSCSPIEVVRADAGEYEVQADQSIFFFFNPFDERIMKRVFARINESIHRSPRHVSLVFLCVRPEVRSQIPVNFSLDEDFYLNGFPVQFYKNHHGCSR